MKRNPQKYGFVPRVMSEDMAAYYCGNLSVVTFRTAMQREAIEPVKLSANRIGYMTEDLDAWLDRLSGNHSSSEGFDHAAEFAKYG